MTVQTRPLSVVTHDAIRILSREIGVVETARFLGQFGVGLGNYTAEREELVEGVSTEDLIKEARRLRAEREG